MGPRFKSEDGRQYGDWTHSLRRTSPKEEEPYVEPSDSSGSKKWYHQTFWIILFLIILWPVGLFMMWSGSNWPKWVKLLVTVIISIMVIIVIQVNLAMEGIG